MRRWQQHDGEGSARGERIYDPEKEARVHIKMRLKERNTPTLSHTNAAAPESSPMQCLGHIPILPSRPEGLGYGESAALETAGICRRSTLYNVVVEDICKDLLERDDIVKRVILMSLNNIYALKRSSSPPRSYGLLPTTFLLGYV
jgi:hypothetical protein